MCSSQKGGWSEILWTRSVGLRYQSRLRAASYAAEQVAAVCFRMKRGGIEFLLVRTGNGRWTFPKGCVEPGLTRAQSAAMEAFEEAGVHGRIEEAAFARYFYRKRRTSRRNNHEAFIVHAHLCEVSNIGQPEEANRQPKWFSVERAKRRLRERRSDEDGGELARVVELAVMRVRSARLTTKWDRDALNRVKFDAFDVAGTPGALQCADMPRYVRRDSFMRGRTGASARFRGLLNGRILLLNGK